MIRRLNLFIRTFILQGWGIRLLHLLLLVGNLSLLFLPALQELNRMLITNLNGLENITAVRLPLLAMLLAGLSLIAVNLLILHRSSKLLVGWWVVEALILNLTAAYFVYAQGLGWPVAQVNLFLLLDLAIILGLRIMQASQEIKFLRRAFSKFVNEDLLNDLIAYRRLDDSLAEHKSMTVLFCDLRNFTAMAENSQPKELLSLLNTHFDAMSRLVTGHLGTIDKYIGDALMAFWNSPVQDPLHITHAVDCAVRMVAELENLRQTDPRFKELDMGIGISSGKMIVGNIGGQSRLDYSVIGDRVNLGSRLESLTKRYEVPILVTEEVVRGYSPRDGSDLIFRFIDRINVKGRQEVVNIFQPLPNLEEYKDLARTYALAYQHYQARRFNQAKLIWEDLSERGDRVSNHMLERLRNHEHVFNSEWNGVWTWFEK